MNRTQWIDTIGLLDQDLIDEATLARQKRPVKLPFRLKPLLTAAVFALTLLVVTPVLAAEVPSVYELMYLVSPEIAQRFIPVQEACEDNGIRMEVVSISIHENVAEIYITMRDLTGDRIDGTTDLFDSYDIHRPYGSSATCEQIGYDEETGTVTFLITIAEWDNPKLAGSNITFSVREFLSHKTELEDVPVAADLRQAETAPATLQIEPTGSDSAGYQRFEAPDHPSVTVLEPSASLCSLAENLSLTGMGYLDGALHLQLQMEEKLTLDPHGYFYLVNEAEERLEYSYSISFAREENGKQVDYQEFVFDLPLEELSHYTLYGTFCTSGMRTQGNWQVTFPLVSSPSN